MSWGTGTVGGLTLLDQKLKLWCWKAGHDGCFSSGSGQKSLPLSFACLDPQWIGWCQPSFSPSLLSLLIQMLIPSRNTLRDTPRNNVSLARWAGVPGPSQADPRLTFTTRLSSFSLNEAHGSWTSTKPIRPYGTETGITSLSLFSMILNILFLNFKSKFIF